jgi:hypothetical protein
VDEASGSIAGADLTNGAPAAGHLPALVTQVRPRRTTAGLDDAHPTPGRADAGYLRHDNAAEDGQGIDPLIAAGRDDPATRPTTERPPCSVEAFGVDPTADAWGGDGGAVGPGSPRNFAPFVQTVPESDS